MPMSRENRLYLGWLVAACFVIFGYSAFFAGPPKELEQEPFGIQPTATPTFTPTPTPIGSEST